MLVLAGVRNAARIEEGGAAFWAAVRALVSKCPRRLQVVEVVEPLVYNPAKCSKADIRVIASKIPDSEPAVNAAYGRVLGYRCAHEGAELWNARGTVGLWVHMLVDGVEGKAWLAGFGCGQKVSQRAWRSIVEQVREDWGRAANLALAGASFKTAEGEAVVISRFSVRVTAPGSLTSFL
jgi:3-methyladenine DNA glycosylase/8-oxoguanine DNA glycosylase